MIPNEIKGILGSFGKIVVFGDRVGSREGGKVPLPITSKIFGETPVPPNTDRARQSLAPPINAEVRAGSRRLLRFEF
jgi:hypothetical protein